jgi:putative nucleotidyltransferase with HDIG domain
MLEAVEASPIRESVERLWPELEWIQNPELRDSTLLTWIRAFEDSPLEPDDLEEHKRCVVHIARRSAEAMQAFLGRALRIDMDVVIAGSILADVGKLLEYERVGGEAVQSERGKALRHPFTGVHLAMACGVPDEVCHIIATHAAEGDLVTRSTEAFIVHHADFMSFEPFKNLR